MRIIKVKDYAQMSAYAAQYIMSQVLLNPKSVLGFATGSTPVGTYAKLREHHEKGLVSFAACTSFNLDEYIGLPKSDPQSYYHFMCTHLFDHIDLNPERIHIPNGMAEDIAAECEAYEKAIEEQDGIDLQLLGIGRNGHIGFNEPDVKFEAMTHEVILDEDTIEANARFFGSLDAVPKRAVSMGIKSIMHAHKILILASGEEKADAVARMVHGPVVTGLPASVLQLHPNVVLIVDEGAGRKL